jgi:hypothetical protein
VADETMNVDAPTINIKAAPANHTSERACRRADPLDDISASIEMEFKRSARARCDGRHRRPGTLLRPANVPIMFL